MEEPRTDQDDFNNSIQSTELFQSTVIELAEKWFYRFKLRMIISAAASASCLLLYHFTGSYLDIFIWFSAVFGGQALLSAFECFFACKSYVLVKENVPKGHYSLKRVQVLYTNYEISDVFGRQYYYVCDGEKVRFGRGLVSVEYTILGGYQACKDTIECGIESFASIIRRSKTSQGYYYLLFVRDKPCIIIPEARVKQDIGN